MDTKEKELSIDTEAGLQEFSQCTKELYAALVTAVELRGAIDEAATTHLKQAEATYHRVRDVVAICQRSLALGIPVNEVLVSEIQTHYNDIATLYDLYVIDTEISTASDIASVPGDTYVTAALTLSEKAKVLLERYEDVTVVPTGKDELSIARFYYDQLVAAAKRAEVTLASVQAQQSLISQSTPLQESVMQTLQDIDNTLNTLDKELDRFFESEEEPVPQPEVAQAALDRREKKVSSFGPYIKRILLDERYAAFVKERFHSDAQFEALLKREVARMETPSKFDILLGITHNSAFAFLKEMTLKEIIAFDAQAREVIRETLLAENILYETYVDWLYLLGDMQAILAAPLHITFGELFVRAELELLLHEHSVESE